MGNIERKRRKSMQKTSPRINTKAKKYRTNRNKDNKKRTGFVDLFKYSAETRKRNKGERWGMERIL